MGAMWAEHWAELGGGELWNSARLNAYVAKGLHPQGFTFYDCGCDTLIDALNSCYSPADGPPFPAGPTPPTVPIVYNLPEIDTAPWYDPAEPVSADFAGLLVTDVTGLSDSPWTRPTFQSIGNGQAIGRGRYKGRQWTVTGYLIGRTCCATTYGLKWLGWQALGAQCADQCGTDDFRFLECCPAKASSSVCPTVPGTPDLPPPRPAENPADFIRTLSRTALIEGPHVVERLGGGCQSCGGGCELLKVELTFASGSPFLYKDPVLSCAGTFPVAPAIEPVIDLGPPPPNTQCLGDVDFESGTGCLSGLSITNQDECPTGCINWFKEPACPPDPDCPTTTPCATDPLCSTAPTPPTVTLAHNPCYCDGLVQSCAICTVPAADVGAFDATTLIQIDAGSLPLRSVRVRAAINAGNWPCSPCKDNLQTGESACVGSQAQGGPCYGCENSPDWDCDACAEIFVTYIPAGGILTIDGRSRSVTLTCNGETVDAGSSLLQSPGIPFDFIDLECFPYCFQICAAEPVATDALFEIFTVPRSV